MRTIEYQRVIPRDLFNEAKLLKCIGQLCLKIHDNMTPVKMSFTQNEEGEPFEIGLLEEGALCILNLNISIKDKVFIFKTSYNSKSNYPLYVEHDYCDYEVFDDKGNFSHIFIDFCNSVKNTIDTILEDWDERKEEFIEYANNPDSYNRKVKTESDFRVFLHSLDADGELDLFCSDAGYEFETDSAN